MNKLDFNGGAYRCEVVEGAIFEGNACNLVAHFATDTITLHDRATRSAVSILSSRTENLRINGSVVSFEQAQTIIENAIKQGGGGGASSADAVSYDNSKSGLQSTNVQGAIDEIGANSQFARNFRLNPFEGKPFIHHLGVEQGRTYYVQSQSLYDIHLANALGARVIEANCHRTLDGVYLVKHGQSNKLGYGLMFLDGATFDQNALFSDLTYEQIKTYVRYTHNDNAPQYGGTIPTLEDFCQEANIFGLSVFLNCPDRDCLDIARNYLQDERIICYGSLERGDFKGVMCEYYDATTAQQVITRSQKIGLPYLFSWRNFFDIEQSTRKEIISQLHAYGILVGSSYGGVESNIISLKDGVDCVSSTYASINVPSNGNDVNIANVNDSRLTLNNATYNSTDNTIDITSGGSVMVIDNNFARCCGAANLRIRYSGTLSIWMGYGNQWTAKNKTYAIVDKISDGAELVIMSQMTMSNYILRIVASEDTKIYDLFFSASIAM